MSRGISELSMEELSQIGRQAAKKAIAEAYAKGLPVTGLFPDEKGELKLARRHADGSMEWINEARPSSEVEILSQIKAAG